MSDTLSKKLKRLVVVRAHGCCEYCLSQEQYAPTTFSVEHIIPRSVGGISTSENLALAYQECNNHKYTKTEAFDFTTGETVPLYDPRHHYWSKHFIWSDDYIPILKASLLWVVPQLKHCTLIEQVSSICDGYFSRWGITHQ